LDKMKNNVSRPWL